MKSSFVEGICNKLVNRFNLKSKTIYRRDTEPYLTRYYLFRKKKKWQPSIYLHCFHMGDEDLELHDHPWCHSMSVILKGSYLEEYKDKYKNTVKQRILNPGSLNFVRGDKFHRVELMSPKVWTLFISGPKTKSWGFWDRDTFEYHDWEDHEKIKNRVKVEKDRETAHYVGCEFGTRNHEYLQ